MADIDIFNGDADGICALLQLRLQEPRPAARQVTGVKRDIELVAQATLGAGDRVTVLDVSFDKNRTAIEAALAAGAEVFYCDHHFAGDVPAHPRLHAVINTAAEVCTSLLVNGLLKGAQIGWAIAGAFGDNLDAGAEALARRHGLSTADVEALRELGVLINYNGYGAALADLHCEPATLYRELLAVADPLAVVHAGAAVFSRLRQGYAEDMAAAAVLVPEWLDARTGLYVLPDAPWARRVGGVFSNQLTNAAPDRAHAVLSRKGDGGFLVSVRAPLNRRAGADTLCRQFASGGGRAAAAGINHLPAADLDAFVAAFRAAYA